MGTAGCGFGPCVPRLGETTFTLTEFGVPVVAVLTVAASFFTARRRGGVLVPVVAWTLITLAAVVLHFAFRSQAARRQLITRLPTATGSAFAHRTGVRQTDDPIRD
ncbi:hypothetical protein ASE48_09230 [Mycobacterium sp. Root265]|uniref:hypothetical protein n=1 Tax=Mycobacterium sp. Root265 TaxID=1736504 RepID=UPI00070C3D6D|nr:hypothetical protein [Mycobacterium sp. Root265]KRD08713.1 hypothetical protein ASE48_09230 [Mycobacterium sp. Root265]